MTLFTAFLILSINQFHHFAGDYPSAGYYLCPIFGKKSILILRCSVIAVIIIVSVYYFRLLLAILLSEFVQLYDGHGSRIMDTNKTL